MNTIARRKRYAARHARTDTVVADPITAPGDCTAGDRRVEAADPVETAVTAAVCNYNGGDLVCGTIASLHELDYPIAEILLVDDGSTDDSVERVRRAFPRVRIVTCGRNIGCLNRVRNRALTEARTRYVLISDNDITFAPDALSALMAVMRGRPDAAVCTPRVLVAEEPGTLHGQGHGLHYLCASTAGRLRGGPEPREPYVGVGGGIQLVDVERARAVGLFNEDLILGWGDDGEFHHRLRIAGYAPYAVPHAHVFHRRVRAEPRLYGYVRNRWTMMIETYESRTIVLAAPMLAVFELLLMALFVSKGLLRDYFRAVSYVASNFGHLLAQRRRVQTLRRVRDRDLFTDDDIDIPRYIRTGTPARIVLGAFNGLARGYGRLIRPLL